MPLSVRLKDTDQWRYAHPLTQRSTRLAQKVDQRFARLLPEHRVLHRQRIHAAQPEAAKGMACFAPGRAGCFGLPHRGRQSPPCGAGAQLRAGFPGSAGWPRLRWARRGETVPACALDDMEESVGVAQSIFGILSR